MANDFWENLMSYLFMVIYITSPFRKMCQKTATRLLVLPITFFVILGAFAKLRKRT
jgi:hypothetical protein